jgi:hypothetical protein
MQTTITVCLSLFLFVHAFSPNKETQIKENSEADATVVCDRAASFSAVIVFVFRAFVLIFFRLLFFFSLLASCLLNVMEFTVVSTSCTIAGFFVLFSKILSRFRFPRCKQHNVVDLATAAGASAATYGHRRECARVCV